MPESGRSNIKACNIKQGGLIQGTRKTPLNIQYYKTLFLSKIKKT